MKTSSLLDRIREAKQNNWVSLILGERKIEKLPKEIGELSKLQNLDLGNNRLQELPPEIGQLGNLRSLNLSNNNLETLPKEIVRLTKLSELNLANNKLTRIPAQVSRLYSLLRLDLAHNNLGMEHSAVDLPTDLIELDLSDNGLTKLPTIFGRPSSIRVLNISNNLLTLLPDEVFHLYALNKLYCENNNISYLPSEIGNLMNLRILDLYNNKLRRLPAEIKNLQLFELVLAENPIQVPPEILNDNNPKIVLNTYFSRRHPLHEAKAILVGQGSVGKTSLVHRILHDAYDQHQTKTDGIAIKQCFIDVDSSSIRGHGQELEIDKVQTIKLNVWDFGGQEIMHATHQFFLTKRSLYLLVLDARLTQEENRVEYWLKIIQSFGGESPVLIVGNKTDQHPLDIDRRGLQKKYPHIVGILETSAATGQGIEKLKLEIAKQVNNLPHVRDLLPETWFSVKLKLEELGGSKNFITQDEYLTMCTVNDIKDESSQFTLIRFLHDLGVVLHFQDDPRLGSLGILNPQWVTNGVYSILNSHVLFQNQGTLTLRMLNDILDLPEYPANKRLFIVDMMKKFELCYDIEIDKSFLIPDLLPKDEPFTGHWDHALAFQYHYNILPSSIISRFIVRMNVFVHKTVWRSGVVLKRDGNTALVKADTEDRKIYVWVTGDDNTRRDFLSAIRIEFYAIHKTIAKIEVEEKVPHPAYPNLVLDYSELIEFERQGIYEFPRKVDSQVVVSNVRELLDGIRPPKDQPKRVFISYGHSDKKFVQKLSGDLKRESIESWWDFDSLKGGQNWQKEIQLGIKRCDVFIVVLSPSSVESEWVLKEITFANEFRKIIIPVLLEECERPISVIEKQYIDFEKHLYKVAVKELVALITESLTIGSSKLGI